jgi:hypothetical protein
MRRHVLNEKKCIDGVAYDVTREPPGPNLLAAPVTSA